MAGTPKPIGRILIIPRGDYDSSTPYNSLDLVRHDKKSWLCKTDGIIGIEPTEGIDWTCIVVDGLDGTNGTDGADGRGITSIQKTGTDPTNPLKDIYTITYTDGTTSTYTVTNGASGSGSGDMLKSVYDTNGDGVVDEADHATTADSATNADSVGSADTSVLERFGGDNIIPTYNGNNIMLDISMPVTQYKSDEFKITNYGLQNKELSLHSNITTKLSKLNSDGTINYSNIKNTPTIPTISDTYSATSSNGMSGKAVASAISGKANTSALDSWFSQTQQATATGEQNVIFTGLDTTKAYELWFETSDGSQISLKSSSLSGTTMTYVVNIPTDCPVPVKFKLRVIK